MPFTPLNTANVLSKLDCKGSTLLVRVDYFNVQYNHLQSFVNGHEFNSAPTLISGSFTVDSVNNTILDIQNMLGNPFDKNPILEYGGQDYEIVINGMKWGLDPLTNEGETFGHFLQYHCTFQAWPVVKNAEVAEPANNIIWDSGAKEDTINDIKDLVGDELTALAEKAMALIDKYKFYRANTECPTPSSKDGASYSDDIAAVIACTKPATVFDESVLGKEPLSVLLLKEAYARGLKVETVSNFNKTRSIVVGLPYNVRQIVQIMNQSVRDNAVSDYYYERLGDLVGLPTESIDRFIGNMRDFGFNRA